MPPRLLSLSDLFLIRTRLPLKEALFGTAAASSLSILGMLLQLGILRAYPEVPRWPVIVTLVTAIGVISTILIFRNRLPLWAVTVLFMLNTTAVSTTFFLLTPYWADHDPRWVPFQPNKLGCLVVGLLSPSLMAGLYGLIVHAGGSTLMFFAFSPELRERLSASEPWALWAFALAGFFVLTFRMRSSLLQQAYTQSQAEVVVAHRLARSFLELKELMNSPIQTLDFSVSLIREKSPDNDLIANRMSQAINRLRAINEVLSAHERKMNVNSEHSAKTAWEAGRDDGPEFNA